MLILHSVRCMLLALLITVTSRTQEMSTPGTPPLLDLSFTYSTATREATFLAGAGTFLFIADTLAASLSKSLGLSFTPTTNPFQDIAGKALTLKTTVDGLSYLSISTAAASAAELASRFEMDWSILDGIVNMDDLTFVYSYPGSLRFDVSATIPAISQAPVSASIIVAKGPSLSFKASIYPERHAFVVWDWQPEWWCLSFLLQAHGNVQPFKHLNVTNITLAMSGASGLYAAANGTLAGVPIGVAVSFARPTQSEPPVMVLSAATYSSAALDDVIRTLWTDPASAIAAELLHGVTFPQVNVTFNSTMKLLVIRALPSVEELPSLTDISTAAGSAFSYAAPKLSFAIGQAVADTAFEIGMTVDIPLLSLTRVRATVLAAPGTGELELQVMSPSTGFALCQV